GFFFRAEDGIRDKRVTGVQTCALPISWPVAFVIVHGGERDRSSGIPPEVELTWYRLPLRSWCGYAGPSTSRIVTKSALHATLGFHEASPLVAASVGETTKR